MNVYEQLLAIPKVELHLHLDGSVDPRTILDLAEKGGIELPSRDLDELCTYLQVPEDCQSLGEYLAKFEYPLAIMQNFEALERIAYELCAKKAKEKVRYFEVRYAPQLHTRKGMALDDVVQAVLDGLNEGQIEFNIKAGLIICALRHHPLETNLKIVELAGRFKEKGVLAFDLAGDEARYPIEDHAELFERARALGLHVIAHAGEAAGAESVKKALDLGAERIGHGVRAEEDPEVLDMVKSRGTLLEVCPRSNLQTKAVKSLKEHPLKRYFDQGIHVSINSDNPTISNTTLVEEYLLIIEELGFTVEEIKKMNLYAAEASFLPAKEKAELIKEIEKA